MSRYVALLRGINVGGKNLIKMADLKLCFERAGFMDVATYIQSGNVLFTAPGSQQVALATQIERSLTDTFKYPASLVLRSQKQMQAVVDGAPTGFGSEPARYRYDVIFLKPPLTAAVALKSVRTKPGVDEAHAGNGVLYFSRLISKASQSQLTRIIGLPIYRNMTIRNFATTTKLLQLMNEEQDGAEPVRAPRTSLRRPGSKRTSAKSAAYDQNLAERVRSIVSEHPRWSEKAMMGTLAFLVNDALCCCVRADGLMVRVGKDDRRQTLSLPHVATVTMRGREMSSFVLVERAAIAKDPQLARWVERGIAAGLAAKQTTKVRPKRTAKRRTK